MRTVLILEDNEKNYEMLVKILEDINEEIHVLYASTTHDAYLCAVEHVVDLFLLDIILRERTSGDISGIQFADTIRRMSQYEFTPIIFITSMEDPKLYAYSDLHCYSYIEKPYDIEKTTQTIMQALRMPLVHGHGDFIYFRKDNILYKKEIDSIIYIENSRYGQTIYATDGVLRMPYKPCKEILQDLGSDNFIQCSRFVIVNWDYVENIDRNNKYITLKGLKEPVEVGKRYLDRILKEFGV